MLISRNALAVKNLCHYHYFTGTWMAAPAIKRSPNARLTSPNQPPSLMHTSLSRYRLQLACLLLGALSLTSTAQAQSTASAEVGGTKVTLTVPAGYCKLERASELGKPFYDLQDRMQANLNQVLLAYIDCQELARITARKQDVPVRYGLYLAPMNKGQLMKVPTGYTRQRVVDEIAKTVPALDLNAMQNSASARASGNGVKLSGMTSGLLGKDANALYLGVAGNAGTGAKAPRFRGVTAMTMLKDVVVSGNLYGPADENPPFEKLWNAQKEYMAALVKAN